MRSVSEEAGAQEGQANRSSLEQRIAQLEAEKEVLVEFVDVADKNLWAEAYACNRGHGVPLTHAERDRLILRLYLEDGKTQRQIADLVGLEQPRIAQIVGNINVNNADADKRRKLKDEDMPAMARHILGGETQGEVAKAYDVGRSTISEA